MLFAKNCNNPRELLDFVQGTEVARGQTGTNLAADTTFTGPTDAFTDVAVGDTIYISGETTPFTVAIKVSNINLTLSPAIVNAHTADATWRAFRGGVGVSALAWPPFEKPDQAGAFLVIYNKDTFSN